MNIALILSGGTGTRLGANRQLSIYNGLESIKKYADSDDNLFIHDATS